MKENNLLFSIKGSETDTARIPYSNNIRIKNDMDAKKKKKKKKKK